MWTHSLEGQKCLSTPALSVHAVDIRGQLQNSGRLIISNTVPCLCDLGSIMVATHHWVSDRQKFIFLKTKGFKPGKSLLENLILPE